MEEIKIENVEVTEPKEVDLEKLVKLMANNGLPAGTVEEIFNLGRRTERREIFERSLGKKKPKKEKVKKDPLNIRIMRKLGYEKIQKPKEEKGKKTE